MYKVFVKKHLVLIGSKEEFYQQFEKADYHLIKPKKKEITALLKVVFLKRKQRIVFLQTNNSDKTFEKFKDHFKIIIAAGGVVQNDKGKILFIFRNGKWDLPKGKLESNEKIEVCAIREVEEECGISRVKSKGHLLTTYHTYKNKKYVLKPCYWYKMSYDGHEKLVPQLEEGITKAKWINPKKMDKIRSNTFNSILDVLEKIEI